MLVSSVSCLRVAIAPRPKHHLWTGTDAKTLCGRDVPAGTAFEPLTAWAALHPAIRCARCDAMLRKIRAMSQASTRRG